MRLALLVVLPLAACAPPELSWTSTTQRIPLASGSSLTTRTVLDGDRVRASMSAPIGSGGTSIEERWGTLTPEALRRVDDALDVLASAWDPPYDEERIGVGHAFFHRVDVGVDGDSEGVIHELDSDPYTTEVRPLSGVARAVTEATLGCGDDLVVLDAPPAACP